jgi:hypothetical protein
MFLFGDGIEAASRLPGDFESERGGCSTLDSDSDWSNPAAYGCALNKELFGRLVVNALNSSAVALLCFLDAGKRESSGICNTCWALTIDDEGAAALKTPAGEVSMASGRVGGFE